MVVAAFVVGLFVVCSCVIGPAVVFAALSTVVGGLIVVFSCVVGPAVDCAVVVVALFVV